MLTILLILSLILLHTKEPIILLDLPEGKLEWTTERPRKAKMCIPAAFTDKEGKVEGEYRIDGKTYNPNRRRLRVSVGNGTFIIDNVWRSDSGFQQLTLVNNNSPRLFRDKSKFIRRALCKKGNRVFIVQSRHKMTLTEFAAECGKVSSNAVYLDMGKYGYGYVGDRILSPWTVFYKNRQTNWLCVR